MGDEREIPDRIKKVVETVQADIDAQDRNDHGYPDLGKDIDYYVDGKPFRCHVVSLPVDFTGDEVSIVNALIGAIAEKKRAPSGPQRKAVEPEPETDLERRERLFRSAILAYAQAATLYAVQVCNHRDNAGRPIPTTPAETSLLMKEGRRLMDQLVVDTKDLGYGLEEIYHAANEAEKEVATSIVQQGKPYIPEVEKAISVLYTNHRGETAMRRIIPAGIFWGATDHHPEEGWLLDCWDVDKKARRTYSLSGFPGVIFPAIESSSDRTTGEDGVDR